MEELTKIPLAEYCISHLGYSVRKKKDCRMWRALVSPSGLKIICPSHPLPDGTYLFKNAETGETGTLKQLLKLEGAAPNFSVSFSPSAAPIQEDVAKIQKKAVGFLEKMPHEPKANYLEERKIFLGPSTFRKILNGAKVNKFGAFFPLFHSKKYIESSNQIVGVSIYRGKKDKFFPSQKRIFGKKGLSVLNPFGKGHVYIFETPIDALSFFSLEQQERANFDGVLISTCGALGNFQKKNLGEIISSLIETGPSREVFACFDADAAGEHLTQQLAGLLGFSPPRKVPPKGKDWNEALFFLSQESNSKKNDLYAFNSKK